MLGRSGGGKENTFPLNHIIKLGSFLALRPCKGEQEMLVLAGEGETVKGGVVPLDLADEGDAKVHCPFVSLTLPILLMQDKTQ